MPQSRAPGGPVRELGAAEVLYMCNGRGNTPSAVAVVTSSRKVGETRRVCSRTWSLASPWQVDPKQSNTGNISKSAFLASQIDWHQEDYR